MERTAAYPHCCLILSIVLFFSISCNRNNSGSHPQYFDRIFDSAKRLTDSGLPEKAFSYLDSSYTFSSPGKYDLVRKYHTKAFYYINIAHQYTKAIPLIDSILNMLQDDPGNYRDDYAFALVEKGHILLEQDQYNDAFNAYYAAKVFFQKYLDTCKQAQMSTNLGLILYKQQKYTRAKEYFQKAFDESSLCSAPENSGILGSMQGSLDNIALCYDKMGIYDSAIIYYDKALNFIAKNEKRLHSVSKTYVATARAVIYGNQGGLYSKLGNNIRAEQLLKESIRINEQPGYDNHDAQYTNIKLANLYMSTGRPGEAYAVIQRIRSSLDTMPNDEAELRWKKLCWNYYDSSGNTEEAYNCYKNYISFKDSFDIKRKDLPTIDFNKTFTNLSQLYEIDLLKKSNQLKNSYLILVIVLIGTAIGVIYLIYRNNLQAKRNVAHLVSLNKQISDHNFQMQKTVNALEQSQEDNTRILKVITHDLRNPITSIVAIADMLLSRGGLGDEINQLLEIMRRSGLTATRMAGEILQSQSSQLEMKEVDLKELLQFTVKMMQFRANEKSQSITLQAEPVTIIANYDKLWRVINNLIGNSIKFSPQKTTIQVQLIKKENSAVITIKDEGIGIAPEVADKVFDPFTPHNRPGTMGEESFGLGLSISKHIIESHKGKLWFESQLWKGSTFYVELPLNNNKQEPSS